MLIAGLRFPRHQRRRDRVSEYSRHARAQRCLDEGEPAPAGAEYGGLRRDREAERAGGEAMLRSNGENALQSARLA